MATMLVKLFKALVAARTQHHATSESVHDEHGLPDHPRCRCAAPSVTRIAARDDRVRLSSERPESQYSWGSDRRATEMAAHLWAELPNEGVPEFSSPDTWTAPVAGTYVSGSGSLGDAIRDGHMQALEAGAQSVTYDLGEYGTFIHSFSDGPLRDAIFDDAIRDIQAALDDMSFARLERLGIAQGTLREHIRVFRAEPYCMSISVAFQQAVMKEIRQKLNDPDRWGIWRDLALMEQLITYIEASGDGTDE